MINSFLSKNEFVWTSASRSKLHFEKVQKEKGSPFWGKKVSKWLRA